MKTVAFVPIKLNNERLPGKNVRPFYDGTPLIASIMETLGKVAELDEVYVYCSSDTIREYLPPGVRYLARDAYYDLSSTPFNEVLQSFAQKVPADIYVLSHATAPFIKADSISKAVRKVRDEGYDSAFAAACLQEFLWKDGKPFNYSLEHIPRTQDLELLYTETCGLYVYRRNLIMDEGRRIGRNPYLLPVTKMEACDINTLEDFQIADAIYHYQKMRKETS